jgi:hypothetical protein
MVKIRVIPHSIPDDILKIDPMLGNALDDIKIIKLSKFPILGESVIWRGMNFKITQITYFDDYDYDAVIQIQWCENLASKS